MEVEIIKANNPFDDSSNGRKLERMRVAAYCRVSTDDEDQIKSYNSMVRYYTDLIKNNKEWAFAGVYADKAITGTKADKREEFQKLIQDCLAGKIDMVIFFSDPLSAHPHDPDVKALLRLAQVFDIPIANNKATADFLITSKYMEMEYDHDVKNFKKNVEDRARSL